MTPRTNAFTSFLHQVQLAAAARATTPALPPSPAEWRRSRFVQVCECLSATPPVGGPHERKQWMAEIRAYITSDDALLPLTDGDGVRAEDVELAVKALLAASGEAESERARPMASFVDPALTALAVETLLAESAPPHIEPAPPEEPEEPAVLGAPAGHAFEFVTADDVTPEAATRFDPAPDDAAWAMHRGEAAALYYHRVLPDSPLRDIIEDIARASSDGESAVAATVMRHHAELLTLAGIDEEDLTRPRGHWSARWVNTDRLPLIEPDNTLTASASLRAMLRDLARWEGVGGHALVRLNARRFAQKLDTVLATVARFEALKDAAYRDGVAAGWSECQASDGAAWTTLARAAREVHAAAGTVAHAAASLALLDAVDGIVSGRERPAVVTRAPDSPAPEASPVTYADPRRPWA